MNWKFWKRPEKPKEVQKLSQLIVYLENKMTITLERPVEREGQTKSKWIGFYQWYFIRDSDRYCLDYNKGSYLIERCDIAVVEIRYAERTINN